MRLSPVRFMAFKSDFVHQKEKKKSWTTRLVDNFNELKD
jgi:hypothetical protein